MKKLLVLVFLLSAMVSKSQDFEGIITWKITSEVTDPKLKAQMEEGKKKMDDPETQAQMKEMKEKMNDPQFKAMMDSNPQMKAQMEAAIKMAEGGGAGSVMPKGYIIKMKNKNVVSAMDGGMMANTSFLYLNDKNEAYTIDKSAKTYTLLPQRKEDPNKKVDIKVTKTSETAKVLNYTCTKYIAESTIDGHTMEQFFWTTNEIKDMDFKSLAKQRMATGSQSMFYDKIEGVPLKIEMKTPQGSMIMEVTDIKKQSIPAAEFSIPTDYKAVASKY
ncbi:MAG TPA: DUF4412 domain-containing protein [Chryseolinea sp.]|nr:DUF4412 domain-containing protein [Chryseolinea sp.]